MARRHAEVRKWRRMPGPMRFALFTAAIVMRPLSVRWYGPGDATLRKPT